MWPFDEIEDAVESTVGVFADIAAGDIGGAVESVVRAGTQIVSNLDVSDVAGLAGTFLGGPIGGIAGNALGTLVEGGDWGDIVSGAVGSFATGGLLPGDLGGIAGDLLGGGTLLGGAEAFLGGGLGDLGTVAANFLGEAGNFDDFGGLAQTFAGTAGRLSELVTGEADTGQAGGAPWPLSELLGEVGLGGAAAGGGDDGGMFGQILEAAGLGGLGGGAEGAAADRPATAAGGGADDDGGLFQQILQRAGIQMPGGAEDASPAPADDDGDAGLFRDILEAAGIDTGRAGPVADRRADPAVRTDAGATTAAGAAAAPSSLQDVVTSLAASGGLSEVLTRMPQNELADLVLNLARPGAADDSPTSPTPAAATDGAPSDQSRPADDDVLGVGAAGAAGADDAATSGLSGADATTADGAGVAAAGAATAASGGASGDQFDDDFDLMLPGGAPAAGAGLGLDGGGDAEPAVEEPAASDFSQSFEAADDVEESFGDLFDPGSP